MAARNRTVVKLDVETTAQVRAALIIGLAAYGEIERLREAQQDAEVAGVLRARHPTGEADTVSKFATALALLDCSEVEPE